MNTKDLKVVSVYDVSGTMLTAFEKSEPLFVGVIHVQGLEKLLETLDKQLGDNHRVHINEFKLYTDPEVMASEISAVL